MVNTDRAKSKIPSLLLDDTTGSKKGWKAFMRYRYQLQQFKKKNPEKWDTLTNEIIADLNGLEKAVGS